MNTGGDIHNAALLEAGYTGTGAGIAGGIFEVSVNIAVEFIRAMAPLSFDPNTGQQL